MKLQDIILENIGPFQVKLTDQETIERDPDAYEADITFYYFDILERGKKVGEMKLDDYFGNVNGWLYNKTFPNDISEYEKDDRRDPEKVLNAFLRSKTGQRWLSNIEKYKVLSRPTNDYRIKDQSLDWSTRPKSRR